MEPFSLNQAPALLDPEKRKKTTFRVKTKKEKNHFLGVFRLSLFLEFFASFNAIQKLDMKKRKRDRKNRRLLFSLFFLADAFSFFFFLKMKAKEKIAA